MSATQIDYAPRVQAGVKFLDEKLGYDWYKKINLEILNLQFSTKCICGQLGGEVKDYRFQENMGFMANYTGCISEELKNDQTNMLTKEWVKVITERKEKEVKQEKIAAHPSPPQAWKPTPGTTCFLGKKEVYFIGIDKGGYGVFQRENGTLSRDTIASFNDKPYLFEYRDNESYMVFTQPNGDLLWKLIKNV